MAYMENSVVMAPFETFWEHGERANSEEPYNDAFVKKCREKAMEYDQSSSMLRWSLLKDIRQCLPRHFHAEVFKGITHIIFD